MPLIRYLCKYCENVYVSEQEALDCESLGIDHEHRYEVGDKFGRLGKVVVLEKKFVLRSNRDRQYHMIAYLVQYPTRNSLVNENTLEKEGKYRR